MTLRAGEELRGKICGSTSYLAFISSVAALGGLLFGFDTVVISGALSPLKSEFVLGNVLEGWLVSSALLGCAVGAAVAGIISDRFGRKPVLVFSSVLFVVGSLGCALAPNIAVLICARSLGGVGVGVASMVSPLYISEVSLPHLRGRLVTLFQLAITVGICLALISNAWLERMSIVTAATAPRGLYHWMVVDQVWRGMFAVELVPSILFMCLCFVIPETPRWFVMAGSPERAKLVLSKVGGRRFAENQIIEIQGAVEHESGSITQLFKPGFRRALGVSLFLAVVSELSGVTVVLYYGPGILERAGLPIGTALGGFVSIGVVNAIFTLIAIWLIDSVGRRPLLFIGNTGAFIALLSCGLLLRSGHVEGKFLVSMLCLFMACFAFSMGPIKWVVISEIFPTRIRGRAAAIATLAVWVTDGLYNQLFPMVRGRIGVPGSFFVFAGILIPQFFFVWKIMPETKGRSLEEIEDLWAC